MAARPGLLRDVRGMSVSWPRAARAAAVVAAAIAALALLPSLLRAPEAPPLDPRVGLSGLGTAAATQPSAPHRRSPRDRRRPVHRRQDPQEPPRSRHPDHG